MSINFPAQLTEFINIDELVLDKHNAKIHTEPDLEKLARIIETEGFNEPITIGTIKNADPVVICGNGRVQAMKMLGATYIPFVKKDFRTDASRIAYGLKNNAIQQETGFNALQYQKNVELIAVDEVELAEFETYEFKALEVGKIEKLNNVLNDVELIDNSGVEVEKIEAEERDDEVHEPTEQYSFVKEGDIWLLGEHRLACIDSTDIQAVERLMDGKKADMVFTDPPYNTGMQAKGGSTRLSHMFDDKFSDTDWQNLLSGFISALFLSLKDNSVAYICLDWRRNHELVLHIKQHFHLSNIIVWDKMVHGLGSDYKYTYELINVCKKGKPELHTNHGDKDYQDIWHIQRKIGRDEEHATKKPIEIITRAISHASQKNDIVLDTFCGSGSTLIACEKTNRICYTSELLPHYCGVAIHRYAKYKNSYDDIFLLQDGKKIPFNEVIK